MISIQQAIEELNRSEIIRDDGEPAMATSGELIILLQRLQALDAMTHRIPVALVLKRDGRVDLTTNLSVEVPLDVDAKEVETVLMAARSQVDKPTPGKSLEAVRKVCDFNGWTLGGEHIPRRAVIDLDFTEKDE